MKAFRTFSLVILLFFTAGAVFSQVSMPSVSMPEITSPSMPSVSMPSFSYGEGNAKESTTTSKNSVGTGLTATALLGLTNTTGLDTLSALLGSAGDSSSGTTGTSSESSSLSSLSAISSLLSGDNTLSALSLTQGSSSSTNYVLLSQIIDKLNDISAKLDGKKETTSSSNAAPSGASASATAQATSSDSSAAASTMTSQQRQVMRFRINGSNILSSVTDIYISKPEEDGSFLLVGDRVYTADYRKRSETFYMFFTPESGIMKVSVKVLQDYENKNSFLYRLSSLSALEAKKTGKLVSILVNDPSFKVDFLLSLE